MTIEGEPLDRVPRLKPDRTWSTLVRYFIACCRCPQGQLRCILRALLIYGHRSPSGARSRESFVANEATTSASLEISANSAALLPGAHQHVLLRVAEGCVILSLWPPGAPGYEPLLGPEEGTTQVPLALGASSWSFSMVKPVKP